MHVCVSIRLKKRLNSLVKRQKKTNTSFVQMFKRSSGCECESMNVITRTWRSAETTPVHNKTMDYDREQFFEKNGVSLSSCLTLYHKRGIRELGGYIIERVRETKVR